MKQTAPILSVSDLSVSFSNGDADRQDVRAVKNISFDIQEGEMLAFVGESGSGKSVTALSVLQLLPYPHAFHDKGSSIIFRDTEIIGADQKNLQDIRGNKISMIFQEPMTSLNPLHSIEKQISETLELHRGLSGKALYIRVVELLKMAGLDNAINRMGALPHELSGGQRQRVMIAMAIANEPEMLIADEPTTALDVTIQAKILNLLNTLRSEMNMTGMFITHDLSIVRKMADKVCVMKDGEIVERGLVDEVLNNPQHEYTKHLMNSAPKGRGRKPAKNAKKIVKADDVKVWFPIKKGIISKTVGYVKAVDGISFSIKNGETIGVVGESGSGKTTLGLAVLRLVKSIGGIDFKGEDLNSKSLKEIRPHRSKMQMVFQDPFSSLNPRMTVGDIIGEGLDVHGIGSKKEREKAIAKAIKDVGLDDDIKDRYPHEFSGGQRQRIAIARALVLKPEFIVLDEPTSALDVSVQAQVLELLKSLQDKYKLSYLFISHDLNVVRSIANYVIVMQAGKIVEEGPAEDIFNNPSADYTKALVSAAMNLN
ncbi:MAG: ABC transporter ATP-binding protein [Alphaproteobacteria bacterium]|nr:ABC transporter ATP-binding protein [Alphaproteobacteria bacterium]